MARSPWDSNSRSGTAEFHVSSGLNRNRTGYGRLELELEMEQNQLREAVTVQLEALDGSSNSKIEQRTEWEQNQPGGLELVVEDRTDDA